MTLAPNAELSALIAAEIDAAGGAITFARFMELALYQPDHGYYRVGRAATGRGGADFLTAPELHPIFGQTLAHQIVEMGARLGDPADLTVREYAAGGGALAAAILGELAHLGREVRYEAIELNAHRRSELAARVPGAVVSATTPARAITGVVVANELLDAFPVHRVVMRAGRLREIHLRRGPDGDGFAEEERDPSTPALAARLADEGVALAEGQQGEINLAMVPWLHEVARGLRRGYVVIVDYGHAAEELYAPRRGAGTLLAYAGHRVVEDPYAAVGHQDLTAHVDFTAVVRAARAAGLADLGITSQAEFLVGAGAESIVERVRADRATDLAGWVALRSALGRLLDPRAMGAFRVCILGRDVPAHPPLRGLAYRLDPSPTSPAPAGGAR